MNTTEQDPMETKVNAVAFPAKLTMKLLRDMASEPTMNGTYFTVRRSSEQEIVIQLYGKPDSAYFTDSLQDAFQTLTAWRKQLDETAKWDAERTATVKKLEGILLDEAISKAADEICE